MNCFACGRAIQPDSVYCDSCGAESDRVAAATAEPLNEFAVSHGFVGRRQELGELRSSLEDALSGQSKVVMLVGEPGIGKTRTAQELASYANLRGAQVLWGRCYEEEGAPPYWPWVQPLKTYLERTSPEELRADLGPVALDLGELLPELRTKSEASVDLRT